MFSPNPILCQYGINIRLSKQHFGRMKCWLIWHRIALISFKVYFKYEWYYLARCPMKQFSCIFYHRIQSSLLISCLFSLMLREGGVSILYQPWYTKRVCAVIKMTSNSITVQPLRLLPSRCCKGIFLPGNCGGWLQLVPGAKRGWGVAQCRLIESFVG